MTASPMAKENALAANKKNWDIDPPGSAPKAPPAPAAPKAAAPKAPPAPAPAAPKAPAAPAAPTGGIGGGLFDRIKAVLEPTDVGGGKSSAAPKADAIYEDDEMYGGFGSPAPPAGPGDVKIPFRATFDKEDKDKK
jgi:hypothetical protein